MADRAPSLVELGGQHLAVRRIGRWGGHDPVLVLLHEGLGSISMWRDFPDALATQTGLPALVYDRLGHGRAGPIPLPRPLDFLEIEARRTLPALLAATGIGRPLLVGHSDGGTIALLFAAAFPDRPVACITEAAHVVFEARTRAGVAAVAERWRTDADFRRRLSRHHLAADALVRGWAEAWLRHAPEGWSMLAELAAVTCPVLALQGALDEHGTTAQLEALAARVAGPVEVAILPGCGHVPHHEQRDVVLARMAAFVATALGRVNGGDRADER